MFYGERTKQEIINFYKENGLQKTLSKYTVSKRTLQRWPTYNEEQFNLKTHLIKYLITKYRSNIEKLTLTELLNLCKEQECTNGTRNNKQNIEVVKGK